MGFIKITISALMISVFTIALVAFAINFAGDNDAQVSLSDDEDFLNTKTNLESNVQSFHSEAGTSYESYQESTTSSQTEASEGGTQFKTTPTSSITQAFSALDVAWKKIFGQDEGFRNIFLAVMGVLTLIVGLYAWKAWKGSPD